MLTSSDDNDVAFIDKIVTVCVVLCVTVVILLHHLITNYPALNY